MKGLNYKLIIIINCNKLYYSLVDVRQTHRAENASERRRARARVVAQPVHHRLQHLYRRTLELKEHTGAQRSNGARRQVMQCSKRCEFREERQQTTASSLNLDESEGHDSRLESGTL